MGQQKKTIFDPAKAREMIKRGRRAKWWRRIGSRSRGFYYVDHHERRITDEAHLERIRSLVIPPAWKHVRVAPGPNCRIQAVGMDTTGRIQYKYHPKFAESRQRKKYEKIAGFGRYLPALRRVTNEHLALEGFPREKVLAIMMRLINSLYFRVGTEKSAHHYKTYGITTLQNKHLEIKRKGVLVFDFVGKSHIKHRKVLVDEELAALMKELKQLGAARKLFHYLDEAGKPKAVRPGDLNRYLKQATAPEFSTKDLRTWGGTLLAAVELAELGKPASDAAVKKNIVSAIKRVAEQLGNTPAVCRGSYVHPVILKAYEKGITLEEFRPRQMRRIRRIETDLDPEEKALMRMLDEFGSK
jgi:DNA topoisomerase I